MGNNLEQWVKNEEELDEIGKKQRKLAILSRESGGVKVEDIYDKKSEVAKDETGGIKRQSLFEKKLANRKKEKAEGGDLDIKSERLKLLEGQIKSIEEELDLKTEAMDEEEKALLSLRRRNLKDALKKDFDLDVEEHVIYEQQIDAFRRIAKANREGKTSYSDTMLVEQRQKVLDELETGREKLSKDNPEAWYGIHLKKLKNLREDFYSKGKVLLEIEYVRSKKAEIREKAEKGESVVIYGHLGTGKTEVAMMVAEEMLLDREDLDDSQKNAVIVSGSKHTSISNLYGHQVLKASEGTTVSEFDYGPIYRAMEEGRPIIIDEANAIPHEVLISLNHILTRRPGDELDAVYDHNKRIKIKEGFCIILTGNLNQDNQVYIDRLDLDPAFMSRLKKVEYDYLPQNTEVVFSEIGKLPEEGKELFTVMISEIMDKNGNIDVSEGSLEKLWLFARLARITQEVFSGKKVNDAFYFKDSAGRVMPVILKEGVISMRAINNTINAWRDDGMRKEFDYYLFENIIQNTTVASDKAYLYWLFQTQGFFNKGDGWPDFDPQSGKISSFDIGKHGEKTIPENSARQKKFMAPREIIDILYGKDNAPQRKEDDYVRLNGDASVVSDGVEKGDRNKDNNQEKSAQIKKQISIARDLIIKLKDLTQKAKRRRVKT